MSSIVQQDPVEEIADNCRSFIASGTKYQTFVKQRMDSILGQFDDALEFIDKREKR
jgi:hypothetical protein